MTGPRPIVIAHHLIWTAYGWWLPNDPRGSTSKAICSDVIAQLGELHAGRKRVQPASREIQAFYDEAAGVLKFPLLALGRAESMAIVASFAEVVGRERYTCYACAIMPDHVHLLIRKHKHEAEEMIESFQDTSRLRLRKDGLRAADHPVWGGPGWKVFLDHPSEVCRTIDYVRANPPHAGLQLQNWEFVTEYDDWPLHEGHSLNSPYVKALRRAGRYP